MPILKVAITGFGNVGRQIAKLLESRSNYYLKKYQYDIRLVGVCTSKGGFISEHGISFVDATTDKNHIKNLTGERFISAVPADVLIEAGPTDIHTGEPGLTYIKTALSRGMKVICLSKGALVQDVSGLMKYARQCNTVLLMSGATASALPTMDLLEVSLAGCKIKQVQAILTGTTNMILSEMMDTACSFDEALRKAQDLGIAEANPSLDTQGWDTANKITIIANAVFDAGVEVKQIEREGVEQVTQAHFDTWKAKGFTPRLVGIINNNDSKCVVSVQLKLFPEHHPFASVHGRMKAIFVETEEMGEIFVMGGASSILATAASVLKDLEHVLRASALT